MRDGVRHEAEGARLQLLLGCADAQRAFTGDDVNPFFGVVVRVSQPRIAKLVQRRRSGRRAAEERVLAPLAAADEVLLEEQRNRSDFRIAGRAERRRGRRRDGSGAFGGGGAALSATSTVADSPARRVTSRSSVIDPSRANRSR